jgi:tRNA uridine 5-carboxymethylaminomethyl modification enzyme
VLTTGTFLRGVVHVGSRAFAAGRLKNIIAAGAGGGVPWWSGLGGSSSSSGSGGRCGGGGAAAAEDAADAAAARGAGALAATMASLGFALGRLKTGTPPRLDGRGIDYSRVTPQPGDAVVTPLSFLNLQTPGWAPSLQQVSTYETRTTAATEALVAACTAAGRGWAPGPGVPGPRYCPSLEAKVARFPGRTHAVREGAGSWSWGSGLLLGTSG